MLIAERHTRLQELLTQRGIADLETLSAALDVSQSTVRRDIELLEGRGLVQRTHGGVIWVGEKQPGNRPYAFDQRMAYQLDIKRRIAKAAKALVQPGQTVLIDGGTTTFYLAKELVGLPLQIVTNSLPIADLFLNDERVELVLTGGLMYPRYGVLLGPLVEMMLTGIHVQTLFLSVAGVSDGSMYNQNLLLVQAERQMMQRAQKVVLLIDSGKFGQQALARLGALDEVDVVVTDDGISDADRKALKAAGCDVVIAE